MSASPGYNGTPSEEIGVLVDLDALQPSGLGYGGQAFSFAAPVQFSGDPGLLSVSPAIIPDISPAPAPPQFQPDYTSLQAVPAELAPADFPKPAVIKRKGVKLCSKPS